LDEESGSPGEKEKTKKKETPMSVLLSAFADDSDPRDVNETDFDLGPDDLPDFDRDDYDDNDLYGDYPDYADYAFGDE
jgi:hypothetical protein